MHKSSNGLHYFTLALSLFILIALALAAMAGFVEAPMLAYFWYLALAGMALMILMTLALAMGWVWNRLLARYHYLLDHWGDGVPGH